MTIRDFARHYINPLHIYCWLSRILGKRVAWEIAAWFERKLKAVE